MGLGACSSCIKYLMFAFNFLFWLLGCAILGVGVWVRVDPNFKSYVEGSNDSLQHLWTGAYILIGVGVVIMIIGFLGCCGAIRESQCMLASFFICLFIIFVALLGAGIWAVLEKKNLKKAVTDVLDKAIEKYDSDDSAYDLMDNVQTRFQCCGSKMGLEDYGGKSRAVTCLLDFKEEPCNDKLFKFFEEHLVIVAGVAIGMGVVMVLGMIFALMLCCAIRDEGA